MPSAICGGSYGPTDSRVTPSNGSSPSGASSSTSFASVGASSLRSTVTTTRGDSTPIASGRSSSKRSATRCCGSQITKFWSRRLRCCKELVARWSVLPTPLLWGGAGGGVSRPKHLAAVSHGALPARLRHPGPRRRPLADDVGRARRREGDRASTLVCVTAVE